MEPLSDSTGRTLFGNIFLNQALGAAYTPLSLGPERRLAAYREFILSLDCDRSRQELFPGQEFELEGPRPFAVIIPVRSQSSWIHLALSDRSVR